MATQPVEDIDAVLGRFQEWTGARAAAGTKAGVREISDEEALASGRYRWKPERANGAKSAAAAVPPSPVAVPGARVRERGKTTTTKTPEPKNQTSKQKTHPVARAQTPAKTSLRKQEKPQPAFREVLAEAISPSEAIVKPQPIEISRQVAISIRLAPSERALIKTRAAEAGITASAYIRQCALEVEQLREQVRQAVTAMNRGARSVAATPVVNPGPSTGFFAWMARKFLPRKTPALALRA